MLVLLLQGKSNKQIAATLNITESTVEYHLKNIYAKPGVSSRTDPLSELGESTGNADAEKLGESTVDPAAENADNGGKPILQRHKISTLALRIRLQEIGLFLVAHKIPVSIIIFLVVIVVLCLQLQRLLENTRECENPDTYTVGQTLQRSNASGAQAHGQFGTIPAPPWQPKSGYVTYNIVKVSLVTHWYVLS